MVLYLENIIKGCIAKDKRCQKLLYERYYGYAHKIAFRYIYRYDLVQDVVNDGFVKFFKHIGSFVKPRAGDVEPYLLSRIKKIVVNTAIDEVRKNRITQDTKFIPEKSWTTTSSSTNADTTILYKELICRVKTLPFSHQIVFKMHVIDGYSHPEIAEKLGISISTSKSNFSKAKASLQKLINKDLFA